MLIRLLLIVLFTVLSINLSAQITVTQSDFNSYFTIGNSFTNKNDTTSGNVNIGSTGSFAISYAGHNFHQSSVSSAVSVSSTAYGNNFPGSTVAIKGVNTSIDGNADTWAFYSLGSSYLNLHGIALSATVSSATMEIIAKVNPLNYVAKIPSAYQDSWTSDFIDTTATYFNQVLLSKTATHNTINITTDGYGTVVTPDNRTLNVLRIKQDKRTYSTQSGYKRMISYTLLAKSGESFSLEAKDTLQASSGVILVDYFSWSYSGTSGIKEDVISANDYRLLSNYPNPFNPSTRISYYLPNDSKVNLTVYNQLGELVKELASGVESKGLHEVNFNADGLSSGTYIYKLNAFSSDGKNSYSSSGKMLLIK